MSRLISSSFSLSTLLIVSGFLLGADCLGVPLDDDDAAEPLLMATNAGSVGRFAGELDSASTLWTASILDSNRVSLAADGATAYVGAGDEVAAFALDGAGTMDPLWSWGAPDDVVALAGPASGRLFVMTNSTLHGLDTNGGELWSVDLLIDLGGVSDDALAVSGSDLILGGDPTRRLDPSTGSVTHTLATGSSDVSDLVISGGVAYIGAASSLIAASSSTLTEQWSVPTTAAVDQVAVSGTSVAYAERGGVVGVVTLTGNPVFDTATSDVYDALLVVENLVVAARLDGALFAWDELDGTEIWSAPELSGPVGSLDSNTVTAFYGHGDVLEGINLSDGSTLWQLSTSGEPVAVLAL